MDPTQRFSSRVEDYIKWRPGYPPELVETLKEACGLVPSSIVADVGSGTGILTELFLRNGNRVFAVEPNGEMRHAAERLLGGYEAFRSIEGRAEASGLGDASVDFVTAGQAFHWFDRELARREFVRILRQGGWVVLIWNERETRSTPFLQAYERLLEQYGTDYLKVDHRQVDGKALAAFYGQGGFQTKTFPNGQVLDYKGVRGRLLSTSYVPASGEPGFEAMQDELSRIFHAYAADGSVVFEYRTLLYWGRLE
ncbi:MAG: class I SAM-dependent methyltransferase [Syntrophobacteraceae bacterium]